MKLSMHIQNTHSALLAALATLLATNGPAIAAPSDPDTLPVIAVTATLSAQDTRSAPATVSVVSREELQARNASNLLEALRDVPGVTASPRQVGGRKTLALRGLEGKHTLTLIDGRRIAPTDDVVGHSDYQYGWLPMSAVERIEVVRGPMSALYGSEALGGVINIITRKTQDHWVGTANLSGGTGAGEGNDSAGAGFFASGPLSKSLLLRVNADYQRSEPVPDRADPRVSEIEGRETQSAGLGLILKPSAQQSIELGWNGADEIRLYDALSGKTAYQNRYDLASDQGHLTWLGEFDQLKTQLRAYRSQMDVQNSRNNGVAPTRPQNMKDEIIDGYLSYGLGAHQLTAGGEWRRETLVNAGLIGGQDDAKHAALFAQDEIGLSDSLVLTAGLRLDHHELFGYEPSPRAYLVWEASPELVIKGGWGHAFKAPTLKQISPNYVGAEGPHTFLGNADVQPESSNSAELTANWKLATVELRASLFRTDLSDLITYKLIKQVGARRTYRYDNVDSARITGLEAGLSWQLLPGLSWITDMTLLHSEDRSTGAELPDRPGTSLNTHLAWKNDAGWSARLGGNYTGSQTDSSGASLPSYWLWNASLGKQFGKAFSLRAGLENLGNLSLAEQSPNFGYAERARRVFVSGQMEF